MTIFSFGGTLTKPAPPRGTVYTSGPFRARDFIVLSVVCQGNPVPEYREERKRERGGRAHEPAALRNEPKKLLADLVPPISVSSSTLVLAQPPREGREGKGRDGYGTTRRHWDKFSATETSNGKRRSWRASCPRAKNVLHFKMTKRKRDQA